MGAAKFGQVLASHNAKACGEGLEQHGHDIGHQHHPQQRVAVTRTAFDIGSEVARVDVRHRHHHGGACEGKERSDAAATTPPGMACLDRFPVFPAVPYGVAHRRVALPRKASR